MRRSPEASTALMASAPTEFAANVDLLEDVAVDTGLKEFLESRFGRYVDKEKMYL